ncbi:type I-C CRISPR-associated protein Cas7/Csd2 [Ileibacterium valens]|uniref:type I-C CRISPR-associated protein Cas7/Csd2 n=1 Tax=Ileibacterium valens TaxID=1862668 RepID=UPI00259BA50F|nr:type I-C CRISPR-associated protein Cas7/Csd2 [Ileibacterium valens]
MTEVIKNRYDFMIVFDCTSGNPNGDPDAGNLPRVDPETGKGLVTDVCLKRKIRNYIDVAKDGAAGYRIYVKQGRSLQRNDEEALTEQGLKVTNEDGSENSDLTDEIKKLKNNDPELDRRVRDYMTNNFYDIRAFGGVMTTFVKNNLNCGQICGPVQLGFAESVDPVYPRDITITRVAITREKDLKDNKKSEMGKKTLIPYGLYTVKGHVSANIAKKTTGFSEEDLALLWEAILNMFEVDHSASRGEMSVRDLIIFKHNSELGNTQSHKLFDQISISKKDGVITPRSYSDYEVTINEGEIPSEVEVIHLQ